MAVCALFMGTRALVMLKLPFSLSAKIYWLQQRVACAQRLISAPVSHSETTKAGIFHFHIQRRRLCGCAAASPLAMGVCAMKKPSFQSPNVRAASHSLTRSRVAALCRYVFQNRTLGVCLYLCSPRHQICTAAALCTHPP